MTKLIFTDIDGTLMQEGSMKLNPAYFEMIRKLTDRGVKFAVASGRHSVSVKQVFAPVLDCIYVVTQNGNVIEQNGHSKVLNPIPNDWVREFWHDLSKIDDVEGVLDTAKGTYCPFHGTKMHHILTDEYHYNTLALGGWDHIPDDEYSMMTIYHPIPGQAEVLNKEIIVPKWADRLDLMSSGSYWIDCIMKDVSKGNALLHLCDQLGIAPEETISFGDNMNDISMLKAAGIGHAVDNARAEVQAAADLVIPGFRKDGVLHVLENVLANAA